MARMKRCRMRNATIQPSKLVTWHQDSHSVHEKCDLDLVWSGLSLYFGILDHLGVAKGSKFYDV